MRFVSLRIILVPVSVQIHAGTHDHPGSSCRNAQPLKDPPVLLVLKKDTGRFPEPGFVHCDNQLQQKPGPVEGPAQSGNRSYIGNTPPCRRKAPVNIRLDRISGHQIRLQFLHHTAVCAVQLKIFQRIDASAVDLRLNDPAPFRRQFLLLHIIRHTDINFMLC